MWTTRYAEYRGGPYLINVTRAFTSDNTCYINLDSICESGGDEYIDISELFQTEKEALDSCIEKFQLKKEVLKKEYLENTAKIKSYNRRLTQLNMYNS